MGVRLHQSILIAFFLGFCSVHSLSAQCPEDSLNVEQLYRYYDASQASASGVKYNDVWGYVDPMGNEYGILGAADSIIIFDVTNTDSIYRAAAQPGNAAEIWRDMKTYDHYMYAVCDGCSEGLKVYDLSYLPDSFPLTATITSDFTSAHNIYVDTASARLYAVGANGGIREGFAIYDLSTTPEDPPLLKKLRLDTLPGEVGSVDYYIHDIFVRGQYAYCSHGNTGYGIWNVFNPDNIFSESILALPTADNRSYIHSSWNSTNNDYAYIASEVNGNEQIYVVDQTAKASTFLDTIWKEPLLACIGQTDNVPHNPYVLDDYVYISYYQDGVQILDISTPDVPIRVGYYDIDTTNVEYNGTTGNWGVYPYLPSGTIIASYTNLGFYALKFTPPVVPIELASFEVLPTSRGTDAQLLWTVATALNVHTFEIERSNDGKAFTKIGNYDYKPSIDVYEYVDQNLENGYYFYRLKMIDYDGSFKYSNIKSIHFEDDLTLSLFPTNVNQEIQIALSQDDQWNYQIYNVSGVLVDQSTFDGNRYVLNVNELTSGIYFIQISNGNQQVSARFNKID